MKKCISIIFLVVFLIGSLNVSAANDTLTYLDMSKSDQVAIMDNQTSILNDINNILAAENYYDKKLEQLNLNNFVKIYSDTDIMLTNIYTEESMKDTFSESNYIYVCYFVVDEIVIKAVLSKGHELNPNVDFTEEERKEILEKAGKWSVSSISIYANGEKTYLDILETFNTNVYDDIILANSQAGFVYPIAIGIKDGVAQNIMLLHDEVAYDILNYTTSSSTYSVQKNVYDFQEMSDIAKENYVAYDINDNISAGGGGTSTTSFPLWLPIVSVGILFVVACFLFKNKQVR